MRGKCGVLQFIWQCRMVSTRLAVEHGMFGLSHWGMLVYFEANPGDEPMINHLGTANNRRVGLFFDGGPLFSNRGYSVAFF